MPIYAYRLEECGFAKERLEQVSEDRNCFTRMRNLPAHDHHQDEPEEEENEASQAVLDPDDLVVSREKILPPKRQLVMVVVIVVMPVGVVSVSLISHS